MEWYNELIPLASVFLDSGPYVDVVSEWKQILVWALLGFVVSYHYLAINGGGMTGLDNPCGAGILVACQGRILSKASAIKATWEGSVQRSSRPLPRDLSSHRNF